MRFIELRVNGEPYEVGVKPQTTFLEVLREDLNLTVTKDGCDLGSCGACTVLTEGKPVLSCLILALNARGKDILTIEGFSKDGRLHPL